ncbi:MULTISPECIES: YrhK family protein [Nocardia]|uniref:YrhK family protein n=1 Tax=Nocardia TaxID=1817 RepID=UPI0018945854|nr:MULTISPECIES: YrhK family protein [Nocardia]MBF6347714.1 YrhK family protein [Nocardia flavorosea]
MASRNDIGGSGRSVRVAVGDELLVIDDRYETASIVNDVLIAVWFTVGSLLFFSESTHIAATWLFLVGSVQFLIRPLIRLTRRVHLRRLGDSGHRRADYDY